MIYTPFFLKKALIDAEFKTYNISFDDFFLAQEIKGFCIDSRKIEKDFIFVALTGRRVDGHDYIEVALEQGAVGIIIQKSKKKLLKNISQKLLKNKIVIIVDDTLHALKQLARIWRNKFKVPVIGITGSVGKTTTKEILSFIFKTANISAYISFKNQNTILGLSLNILKMREEHKITVFELGISHTGEMEDLVDVLRPTIGVITYICNAHTQGLGSIKNIIKEKQKIFKFFRASNVGIVWGDKSYIKKNYYNFPIITFGFKTINNIQARMIRSDDNFNTKFNLKIYSKKYPIKIDTNHLGFINNILAASAVATFLGIKSQFIVNGVQDYQPFEGRFEKKRIRDGKGTLIHDSYNASPESMKAALTTFASMKSNGHKIVVLGDMLELGDKGVYWHRRVGFMLAKNLDLDFIILVGKLSENIVKTSPAILKSKIQKARDWRHAKEILNKFLIKKNNNLILFKASRGIGFDNIIKDLC